MATDVFYSVCPFGTGNLLSGGSPTIVVDGSGNATLTLGGATQVDNIGVGVAVTYNSITSYIDSITSATSFHLVTALGAVASSQTSTSVTGINHEYASLSAFEAGFTDANHINNTSLVSADVVANACCYYDHDDQTLDTSQAVFNFGTTDATRYVRIHSPLGGVESINPQFPTDGIYSTNKYVIQGTNVDGVIKLRTGFVRSENIQINPIATGSSTCYGVQLDTTEGDSDHQITKSIILATNSSSGNVFGVFSADTNENVIIKNSIIYGGFSIGVRSSGHATFVIYNSTISGSTLYNVRAIDSVINVVSFDSANDFHEITTITNCASDDGDGTNPQTLDNSGTPAYANEFTNAPNGNFSLVSGGVCEENGTDLSGSGVTDDIIGTSRPQSTNYDIGAFELIVSSGVTIEPNTGALTIAGLDPSVSATTTISSTLGTLSIAGVNPDISVGTDIFATSGALNIAGINPDISVGETLSPNVGSLNIAGINPDVYVGIDINCTLGAVSIEGLNASVDLGITIDCNLGELDIAGINPEVLAGTSIDCNAGTVEIQGLNPVVDLGAIVEANAGAVLIAGLNPDVSAGINIDCTKGSVDITGFNPSVLQPIDINCNAGALDVSGKDATIISTLLIEVSTGTLNIVGFNPIVELGEPIEIPQSRIYAIAEENRTYPINAENRTYAIT